MTSTISARPQQACLASGETPGAFYLLQHDKGHRVPPGALTVPEDTLENQEKSQSQLAGPSQEAEAKYAFPPTDQKPVMHYDRMTNSFWIGFRLDRLDYEGAKRWIDSCKFQIYMTYCKIAQTMAAQEHVAQEMRQSNGKRSLRDILTGGIRRA